MTLTFPSILCANVVFFFLCAHLSYVYDIHLLTMTVFADHKFPVIRKYDLRDDVDDDFNILIFPDEFVVETVVSSNEIISDDPQANTRPFGESLAVVAKSSKTHLSTYALIVVLVGIVVIIFIVVSTL